ncbi:MAG: tRNA pseudouridine(55) synthase TruB [Deltaproteobacteria bacterium]|nr:tRNA pseudouridine(55) synthase TruB [Deltaproteobacteria bacterium]
MKSPTDASPELSGVLLVDKMVGITSHDLVNIVRRISGQKSVGHAGTLDPMATGLMTVLLGQATKLEPWLVKADKTYLGSAHLGLATDTDDITGQMLSKWSGSYPDFPEIEAAMKSLEGPSEQTPPAYSAVKVAGRPAYKAARQGHPLDLPPRKVVARVLKPLDWSPPLLTFEASVSSGYYVRALARDLGRLLGLGGGALASLRRLSSGAFTIDRASALPSDRGTLEKKLISPREALAHIPELVLSLDEVRLLCSGRRLPAPPDRAAGQYLVAGPGGRLAAVVEISASPPVMEGGAQKPPRPFLRPLRVFTPADQ